MILALDCGTSSTKAIALDDSGRLLARASVPLELRTPDSGWVEHSVEDLLASVDAAVDRVLEQVPARDVIALGISNQRESMALWRKDTGEPESPVLSWQDRRATSIAQSLTEAGHAEVVRTISGLPLDPMFSAVKATWLLDTYDPRRTLADAGELTLGTVDTLVARHLTGLDVTEPGNASRTSLLDISTAQWSNELLDVFGVPRQCMATVGPSARSDLKVTQGPLAGVPLAGLVGDSHAALFSHRGWNPGVAKATLGTGSSVMATVDSDVDHPGLCRTIGWRLPDAQPVVALEANILAAGATLAWLAGVFGLTPEELADEAVTRTTTVIVPAFNGLGAPWWEQGAQAIIDDLSLATTRGDFARAALESIAWQLGDVVLAMRDCNVELQALVLDGSMTSNRSLVQMIADATRTPLHLTDDADASARGAADMAAIGVGAVSLAELDHKSTEYQTVFPQMDDAEYREGKRRWDTALAMACGYGRDR